jgi:hypothetical protein
MIDQRQKEFTLDTLVYLMNLKTQGLAKFIDIKKVAAPATLKCLRQRDFTGKQYTTIVMLFTAMKYYDVEFWKEVTSYLKDIEFPDAVSYMQLHASLSVVNKQIDIGEEMKVLE